MRLPILIASSKSCVTKTIVFRSCLLEPEELVLQPVAGQRVCRAERLVHQHHRRVGGERAGDPDPLLLAAGELARQAVPVLTRLQADQVEQFIHPRVDPLAVPAEHLGHQPDVGRHAHVREEADLLDDVADPAA